MTKILTVVVTRDQMAKLPTEVFEHELPILQLLHGGENKVKVVDSQTWAGDELDARTELERLRNKYDKRNLQVVDRVYPRGVADLKAAGLKVRDGEAVKPSQTLIRRHKPEQRVSGSAGIEQSSAPGADKVGEIEALAKGTIPEITAALPSLSNEQLDELEVHEGAKDSPRAGLMKAIEAERDSRN
ncbi:hypothetical protein [Coralloluteibacterium thermophilus]|uniref:Uncharacterized protein n=1 Tax=Coralloluteibacterium thermophilum TaxID=2707049 RepID=A0ABV9NJL1_9GAMM